MAQSEAVHPFLGLWVGKPITCILPEIQYPIEPWVLYGYVQLRLGNAFISEEVSLRTWGTKS